MKKIILLLLAAASLLAASSASYAWGYGYGRGGGYYGPRTSIGVSIGGPIYGGFGYGGPTYWEPAPVYYPAPPVYYPPPPIYIQPEPQKYIEREDTVNTADAAAFRYYCSSPSGYYPQIQRCPNGWLKVVQESQASQPR